MEVAVSAPVLGQERAGAAEVEHMNSAGGGKWWQNASSDALLRYKDRQNLPHGKPRLRVNGNFDPKYRM
jgi:hypothetical protein